MSFISCRRMNKIYSNGNRALRDFSLEIEEGEFIVLVGPSGCGKSTLLRMIAGLEEITTGELFIDGSLVNEKPAKDREIAMVFQNYALYPHLSVFDNMAFGLKLSKMPKAEIAARVKEASEILGISELLTRKPGQLSGGQKQRVALGRALVRRPKIFLLDEPLSNVDAKIRAEMRSEILKLHHKLGTTFIYVTHDQIEAMTMASRIVVMNKGEVQQIGSPMEIYQRPKNLFVASFIGSPEMNFFDGTLSEKDGRMLLLSQGGKPIVFPTYKRYEISNQSAIGGHVIAGIRPDNVKITDKEGTFSAPLFFSEYFGQNRTYAVKIPCSKKPFLALTSEGSIKPQKGENLNLALEEKTLHLFAEDGKSILGVPEEEFIPGLSLFQNEGKYLLHFGKDNYEAPHTDLLLDLAGTINKKIAIGFPSSALSVKKKDGSMTLKGTVKHIQDLISRLALYIEIGEGVVISFVTEKDEKLHEGDQLTFFLDLKEIAYYDEAEGERISAKFPLFSNKVHLSKKGRFLAYQGKPILSDETLKDGDYVISKDSEIRLGKSSLLHEELPLLVIDDDCLGKKTIVYAKSRHGDYLSFLTDSPFDRHNKPMIRVKITKQNLSEGK